MQTVRKRGGPRDHIPVQVARDKPLGLYPLSTATKIPRSSLRNLLMDVKPAGVTNAGSPLYTIEQAEAEYAKKKSEVSKPHSEVKRLVDEEKLRKLRIENEVKAGKLIKRDLVAQALSAACSKWHEARLQIESEMPNAIVGKDLPETREEVKRWTVRISQVLAALADSFPQEGNQV